MSPEPGPVERYELPDAEPTPAELAAIEAEWPSIAADLAAVDAQIRVLNATGGPTQIDRRRLRRAEHRALDARRLTSPVPARAAS
jgi:Family of unknown function (DUF6284)